MNPPAVSNQKSTWWSRPSGLREVLIIAFPLVISSLSWTVMTFVDRIFLMWWSEQSLAASFPSALLWWTSISLAIGTCLYVQTFVAQFWGANLPKQIGPVVWQGIWIAVLITPLAWVFIPLAPAIFAVAGHDKSLIAEEVVYFNYLSLCTPALLVSHAMSGFFSGRGQTWIVMLVDAGAALLNVVLDYWFIFGGLGLEPGGIAGAAIATSLAFYAKLVVYFYLFLRPANKTAFDVHRFEYRPKLFRRLLKFGGPSGVQFFLEAGGFTTFVLLVGRLGQTELAATNMAFNVSSFAFMPVFGLGTAASILVGTRLGAGEVALASRAVWTTAVISFIYMGAISAGYVFLPELFLLGFSEQQQGDNRIAIKEISLVLMRYVAAYNLFDAMNIVFVSAIKGAGDTRFVMYTSLIMGALLGVVTWIGLQWFDFRLHGCWIWVTVWVCALGLIYLARFQNGSWRTMSVIEPNLLPIPTNDNSD